MKRMIMGLTALVIASMMAQGCASQGGSAAAKTDSFDQSLTGFENALKNVFDNCESRLPKGTKIAFTGWTADTEALSDYLITELQQRFDRNGEFVLVERNKMKAVEAERNYQYNGHVSDESLVSMAQEVGARTVIYGNMTWMGRGQPNSFCRLTVSATDVEKNVIQATSAYDVRLDPRLQTLLLPLLDPHYKEKQEAMKPYQGKDNRSVVTVTGNHQNGVYREGERLVITIRSDRDGYFKVSHVDVGGNIQTIFPHSNIGKNNFIRAGETRIIPDNQGGYEMGEPYGEEYILVAVYDASFNADSGEAVPLTSESVSRGLKVISEKGNSTVTLLGAAKYPYTILPK